MIVNSTEALKTKAIYDENWVNGTIICSWRTNALIASAISIAVAIVRTPVIDGVIYFDTVKSAIVPFVAITLGLLSLLTWIALNILFLFGYNPQMRSQSPKGAWIGSCPKCADQVALALRKEAVTTDNFRCKKCNILIRFWEGEFSMKGPD